MCTVYGLCKGPKIYSYGNIGDAFYFVVWFIVTLGLF